MKPRRREECWTWITIPRNRWDNDDNGYDDYDEREWVIKKEGGRGEANYGSKGCFGFVGP